MDRHTSGSRFGSRGCVQRRLELVRRSNIRRLIRTRQSGRRHFAGTKLARNLFPGLRMVADVCKVEVVQLESGRLELTVVAGDSILIDNGARRRWRLRIAYPNRQHA